jgi:hypothetical protein
MSTENDPQSRCYLARCLGSQQSKRTDTLNFPAASVCDWVHLDLCLVCLGGGPSLITCQVKGCDRLLHHMCQAEWESAKEGREMHGSRKLCAHNHPVCLVNHPSCAAISSPPATTLGSSKSTMSTLKTNISSPPATTQGSSKSTMSTLKTTAACVPPRHERSTRMDTHRLPAASVCNWAHLDLCLVCFGGRALPDHMSGGGV